MKQTALLLIFLVFVTTCVHAQKTFTVTYVGSLPDVPSSFFAYPSTSGAETTVFYAANQTIKSCTTSPTTLHASCIVREGSPGVAGNSDGPDSLLNTPSSIEFANSLFADTSNHQIRKYGYKQASRFAGSGIQGFMDGPVTSSQFNNPIGICFYSNSFYIADAGNYRIRKISDGKVSTIAGTGEMGFSGDNGPALNAKMTYPYAITANVGGVYFIDVGNYRIRKIDHNSGKVITTVAGNGGFGSNGDNGLATDATINPASQLISHPQNSDIYFVDYSAGSIRVVLPNGKIHAVMKANALPNIEVISLYDANTLYVVTRDKTVYILKAISSSSCAEYETFIDGKCISQCFGSILEDACGGSSRGECLKGACACKTGFSGARCEVTEKANGSSVIEMNILVIFAIIILALF